MTSREERIYQKVHGASLAVDRAMKQCVCHQPMMAHEMLHLAKALLRAAMEIMHEPDSHNNSPQSDKGQPDGKLGSNP